MITCITWRTRTLKWYAASEWCWHRKVAHGYVTPGSVTCGNSLWLMHDDLPKQHKSVLIYVPQSPFFTLLIPDRCHATLVPLTGSTFQLCVLCKTGYLKCYYGKKNIVVEGRWYSKETVPGLFLLRGPGSVSCKLLAPKILSFKILCIDIEHHIHSHIHKTLFLNNVIWLMKCCEP